MKKIIPLMVSLVIMTFAACMQAEALDNLDCNTPANQTIPFINPP